MHHTDPLFCIHPPSTMLPARCRPLATSKVRGKLQHPQWDAGADLHERPHAHTIRSGRRRQGEGKSRHAKQAARTHGAKPKIAPGLAPHNQRPRLAVQSPIVVPGECKERAHCTVTARLPGAEKIRQPEGHTSLYNMHVGHQRLNKHFAMHSARTGPSRGKTTNTHNNTASMLTKGSETHTTGTHS